MKLILPILYILYFTLSGSSRLEVLCKKVFLKILQNSQQNTWGLQLYQKKRLWHRCFPMNLTKFLRTTFFYRTPPVAASVFCLLLWQWSVLKTIFHKAKSQEEDLDLRRPLQDSQQVYCLGKDRERSNLVYCKFRNIRIDTVLNSG